MRFAIVLALFLSTASAQQLMPKLEGDYGRGFCDAVNAMMRNRDHYRKLVGAPQMNHQEVMDWIYARPWKDDGSHRTSPRRLDQPVGIPQVGPPDIESIDLYLMIPPEICKDFPDAAH